MNTPSKADRVSFWQHSYARSSFIQAHLFTELLLRISPPINDTLRRALTIAIVTAYSRPYKQRKPVRLSDDIVPTEFRGTHDSIIEIRDKSIAHRDLDGPVADWGFISQLRVTLKAGQLTIDTISSIFSDEKARELLPLLDFLIPEMDRLSLAFVNDHLTPLQASDGSYVVSLDETPDQWLLRA